MIVHLHPMLSLLVVHKVGLCLILPQRRMGDAVPLLKIWSQWPINQAQRTTGLEHLAPSALPPDSLIINCFSGIVKYKSSKGQGKGKARRDGLCGGLRMPVGADWGFLFSTLEPSIAWQDPALRGDAFHRFEASVGHGRESGLQ
jgi:hypothetical protein